MELTIEWNHDCMYTQNQTDTIKIRRRQRKEIKCGYCDEVAIVIQANRK
jgi:hypothetical protein